MYNGFIFVFEYVANCFSSFAIYIYSKIFNNPLFFQHRYAQLMLSLVPSQTVNEKTICLEESGDLPPVTTGDNSGYDLATLSYNINLRNACFDVLLSLLSPPQQQGNFNLQ